MMNKVSNVSKESGPEQTHDLLRQGLSVVAEL